MATTLSLSSSSYINLTTTTFTRPPISNLKKHHFSTQNKHPLFIFPKSDRYNLIPSSTSQSSSSSSSSTFFFPSSSTLLDPCQTGRFLSNEELEKLQFLQNFRYFQELETGSVWVRVMREDEMDMTVDLLAESFAESMLVPKGYANLLGILVKQYLVERRTFMPHTATLIGFYKGVGEEELAGTVEISFNKMGANASPPTPTPPKNSPYICN